jgi:hypothetical protein
MKKENQIKTYTLQTKKEDKVVIINIGQIGGSESLVL